MAQELRTQRLHSAILGAMKLYFAGPLFTTAERTWNAEVTAALRAAGHEVFLPQEQEPGRDSAGIFATDVGGIDWADGLVAIMDGPDPDSGTSWEVGYAFGMKKWIVLVRTDIRANAGSTGDYNSMLAEAATIRIDMPAASTVEVIATILGALARDRNGERINSRASSQTQEQRRYDLAVQAPDRRRQDGGERDPGEVRNEQQAGATPGRGKRHGRRRDRKPQRDDLHEGGEEVVVHEEDP